MNNIIARLLIGLICLTTAMSLAAQNAPAFGRASGASQAPPSGPSEPNILPPGAISQSTSLDILPGSGIACVGAATLETKYLRRFFLAVDHGINQLYSVDDVDIGIEVDTDLGGACAGNPITVNVYSLPIGDDFLYANMTLVETADYSLGGGASGTIVNVPMPSGGNVNPLTDDLVVEWVSCDHSADGGAVFPGANSDAEIQPSYIAAAACGITEPATLGSLGFPDSHNVLTVQGSLSDPQPLATFAVDKDFTDDNPMPVRTNISCDNGLPLEQGFWITEGEGDGVVFVVTQFTDGEMSCTVTEESVSGYSTEYFDGSTTNTTGCVYENVVYSERNTCLITNTPLPVTVTVNKEWVYENEGNYINEYFEIALECNAVIDFGYPIGDGWYRTTADGKGNRTFNFTVHPTVGGNTCNVTETLINDSGIVVDDSDCQGLAIDLGQGASCTITNSVFFEGVPTLNQYGMAIMALLMLGMGFVGFRRFM